MSSRRKSPSDNEGKKTGRRESKAAILPSPKRTKQTLTATVTGKPIGKNSPIPDLENQSQATSVDDRKASISRGRRKSLAVTISGAQNMSKKSTDEDSNPYFPCENTYKMAPDYDAIFPEKRAQKMVASVLQEKLEHMTSYDQKGGGILSKEIADAVMVRIRELPSIRHKYVCQVMLGEDAGQGMQTVSRFLWNSHCDSHATAIYQKGTIFAQATIYAVYFE